MSDEQRFLEPWTPAVGTRVRVRLSGECRRRALKGGNGEQRLGLKYGHLDVFDGMTGVVIDHRLHPDYISQTPERRQLIDDHFMATGHPYTLVLDSPFRINGFGVEGDTFAAIELEPAERSGAAPEAG